MTYAQIKQHALKQLDEDPHDMHEFGDLLGVYVNEGYQTALIEHAKPRETYTLRTNKDGDADLSSLSILKIVQAQDHERHCDAFATLNAMGDTLHTAVQNGNVDVVALITYPDMVEDNEEPRLPERVHAALADYACYRFLSNGNMAKQSRAQFYLQQYMTAMSRIRPQGMGSVTGLRNLYTVTDARWTR